jgi:hypothetical protein
MHWIRNNDLGEIYVTILFSCSSAGSGRGGSRTVLVASSGKEEAWRVGVGDIFYGLRLDRSMALYIYKAKIVNYWFYHSGTKN